LIKNIFVKTIFLLSHSEKRNGSIKAAQIARKQLIVVRLARLALTNGNIAAVKLEIDLSGALKPFITK